jgi:hypothetical protein
MGGHLLTPEMVLDTFLQQVHRPPPPLPGHPLACGGPQSMAGKGRAATLRSVAQCGTPPGALAHMAQVARGGADAHGHARAFVAPRRPTHGLPRAPAMTTAKPGDMAPLSRGRGRELARCRVAAARLAQGDNAVPGFVGHGRRDRCVVVAALGPHPSRTPIVSPARRLAGERAQGGHHPRRLAVIREMRWLAVARALAGNRREGHQDVPQTRPTFGH